MSGLLPNKEVVKAIVYLFQNMLERHKDDLESSAVGAQLINFLEAGADIVRANMPVGKCTPILNQDQKLVLNAMYGLCTPKDLKPYGVFQSGSDETALEFKSRISGGIPSTVDESDLVVYTND